MSTQDPNIALLETTARHLAPLLDHVVFVGGSIVGLQITDPGALPVRATKDVDIVAEIAGPGAYYSLGEKMAGLGFGPYAGGEARLQVLEGRLEKLSQLRQ